MTPPIFAVCALDAGVTALLGADVVRLFPFGMAPQNVTRPYAVWQVIGGQPENFLAGRPDAATFNIQVDVYGDSADSVRAVAKAIQQAVELDATVTAYRGESREQSTMLHRTSFDVDWIVLAADDSSS